MLYVWYCLPIVYSIMFRTHDIPWLSVGSIIFLGVLQSFIVIFTLFSDESKIVKPFCFTIQKLLVSWLIRFKFEALMVLLSLESTVLGT